MRSCTRAASHGVQSDEPEGRVWCTICAGERACGILVASRVPTPLVGACVMCVRINCDCAFKWLARVLGLRRPELPTRRQTVGQKRHTEEDRRTGREEGATGRMQCANGHDLDPCLGADSGGIWGWAQVRATVAAAEASSGAAGGPAAAATTTFARAATRRRWEQGTHEHDMEAA